MGKKGDALRAAKQQAVIWHLTREQMAAHDRAVVEDYKKRFDENLRAAFRAEEERINAEILAEWKRRADLFSGTGLDNIYTLLSMTLAVPIAVLIEEFGWRPLPAENRKMHPRSRLARFTLRCQEILEDIASDEQKDIRTYCEQVWEQSGVRFQYGAEEGKE